MEASRRPMLEDYPAAHGNEGLAYALNFLRNPTGTAEERAHTASQVAKLLVVREEEIADAHGYTLFILGGLVHALKAPHTPGSKEPLWRLCEGVEEWFTFGHFCQAMLNCSLQKANLLEKNWEQAQQVGMTPEELEGLGYSTAHEVLKVAKNRDEVEQWLTEFANCDTKTEFKEKLQAALPQNGAGKEARLEKRLLKLTKDEAAFFDESIEIAALDTKKELGRNAHTEEMVLFILQSWRQLRERGQ